MSQDLKNAKNFADILSDYQFFVDHSDEADRNLGAVQSLLSGFPTPPSSVLDFGCGRGEFLAALFAGGSLDQAATRIHLVEPSLCYRQEAERRLHGLAPGRVTSTASFDPVERGRFDVILANHVLYYVPELLSLLGEWFRASHESTRILVTLANRNNALVRITEQAFALLREPAPFQSAVLLKEALAQRRTPYRRKEIRSELRFVDQPENRARILRFILGASAPKFKELPVALFDPYVANGRIRMELSDDLFEIRPAFAQKDGRRKGDLSAA